jgi:hypothetical protein
MQNTGVSTINMDGSTIQPTTAKSNGGIGYVISSSVTLLFTTSFIDTPKATNNRGGAFYLSATTGTTTITLNSMTFNSA